MPVPRLVAGFPELQQAMLATVTGARECLVAMGSRSRDARYLKAIETVLAERPALVCYRVLFGLPHHQVLKDHLIRLLELRDPDDRTQGVKTLHLGLVEDTDGITRAVLLRQRADGGRANPVSDLARGV